MESRCCEDPSHTCFRKRGARGSPFGYAVCLPSCPEDGEWDCEVLIRSDRIVPDASSPPSTPPDSTPRPPSPPPSRPCSARYETCWLTHCCKSTLDGCYRRRGKQFAMCKPLPSGGAAFCEDAQDSLWQCPRWLIPPPDLPALPPATLRSPPTIRTQQARPPSSSQPSLGYPPQPQPKLPQLQPKPNFPASTDSSYMLRPNIDLQANGGVDSQTSVYVRKLSWPVQLLAFLALAVCSAFVTVASHKALQSRQAVRCTSSAISKASRPIGDAANATVRVSVRMARSALPTAGVKTGQRSVAKYTRKMDQEIDQAEPAEVVAIEGDKDTLLEEQIEEEQG